MTLTLPAFLDAFEDVLDLDPGPLTAAKIKAMIKYTRAAFSEHPTPALGWSEWLDWAGGPCPLPRDADVEVELSSPIEVITVVVKAADVRWDHAGSQGDVRRFRYRCDPSGWLPRGDFVPPAELWRDDCPVRCEWTCSPQSSVVWRTPRDMWDGGIPVTHIRLLQREKAGEASGMPEGWMIDEINRLVSPDGLVIFAPFEFRKFGPDTIRRAVDAWLASMKERGNG